MKKMMILALLLLPMGLTAQSEGETKDIDGQKFKYQKGIWVHEALGSSYTITDAYTAVHKDTKWSSWYNQGSSTLKGIMDLGPNVVFSFKGADGSFRTYAVFKNKSLAKKAVAGGSAAVATGLGGSAAGAAAAGGAAAGGGAAAAGGGTILGMSATTAAIVGGAVVAGAVVVANDDNNNTDSATKR